MDYKVIDGSIVTGTKGLYKMGEIIPSEEITIEDASRFMAMKIVTPVGRGATLPVNKALGHPITTIKLRASDPLDVMPMAKLKAAQRDSLMFAIHEQYGIEIPVIRKAKKEQLIELIVRKRGFE
jgi:hypothetical protein